MDEPSLVTGRHGSLSMVFFCYMRRGRLPGALSVVFCMDFSLVICFCDGTIGESREQYFEMNFCCFFFCCCADGSNGGTDMISVWCQNEK